jgi:predicted transcriptional regulator of viral defense system
MHTSTHKHAVEKPRAQTSDRMVVSKLSRKAKTGLISVATAAAELKLSSRDAALKLGSLARRGWLQRARRGLYLILPLEAEPGRPTGVEDPWVLGHEAFAPCYIGGWSAAEHWGLTEQIFRSTFVITAANIRTKATSLLGSEFRLFRVPRRRLVGAMTIWRGSQQVLVSGRERTIVDCLRNPELCGGIRSLFAMLLEYTRSHEFDPRKLLDELSKSANGAAWKRFGYLIELIDPEHPSLLAPARAKLSAGNIKLDPAVRTKGRLLRGWRLWVNVGLSSENDEA